jgi:uncharacterized membrane protein
MKLNFFPRLWRSFSPAGMVLGTLFFAASLTPSLIPRTYLTQGVLSGCAMAAGYGLGVLGPGSPTTSKCRNSKDAC